MRRSTIKLGIGAAAVLFGIAACSSDHSTGPGTPAAAEAKASTRQAAGEGAAMMIAQLDANNAAIGASNDVVGNPGGPAEITVNCGGPFAGGWYTCTADLENGLMVSRSIRFWEGTSLGLWWNPPLTDSVNHKWNVDGSVQSEARAGRMVTVNDTAAATMSVIRPTAGVTATVSSPNKHQWDGTASGHHTGTYTPEDGVTRTAVHTVFDTVSAVLFQNAALGEPLSALRFDHEQHHHRLHRGRQYAERRRALRRDLQRHAPRDAAGRGDLLRSGSGYAGRF